MLEQLIECAHEAYRRGLVSGTGGNVSLCDGEFVYITSTTTLISVLVPPMSMVIRFFSPISSEMYWAPTTPAAGPESPVLMGNCTVS